jgi:uncharacterized protein (TIGR02452 family)
MNKEQLIAVFENTTSIINSTPGFQLSITSKHNTNSISVPRGETIANIQTINSDTVSAALEYSRKGRTAILNMASFKRPGGGVANGAKAQEECLFRCSNLSKVISNEFYPLGVNEGLYTRDAVFFKDFNYNQIEPFMVDVITVAAINLSKEDNPKEILDSYDVIMMDKMRLMFDMALQNGCKNIILGAWGCGVFSNNPVNIASMFEEVMMKRKNRVDSTYHECFENIIFAVINDHNSVGDNYDVFSKFF